LIEFLLNRRAGIGYDPFWLFIHAFPFPGYAIPCPKRLWR
jgi:hypothetical protein